MLLLSQHLDLMLREPVRSRKRLSRPPHFPHRVKETHHKGSVDWYLAVPDTVVHLLPHPFGNIKSNALATLCLHCYKQIHKIAIDIILVPNLGQQHTPEHTVKDVINRQEVIGFTYYA